QRWRSAVCSEWHATFAAYAPSLRGDRTRRGGAGDVRNVVAVVLLVVAWLTAVAVGVQLATPTQSEAVTLAAEGPRLAPETSAGPPAEATTVGRQEQVQLRGCVIRFDRKDRMGRTLARKHVNKAHAC